MTWGEIVEENQRVKLSDGRWRQGQAKRSWRKMEGDNYQQDMSPMAEKPKPKYGQVGKSQWKVSGSHCDPCVGF